MDYELVAEEAIATHGALQKPEELAWLLRQIEEVTTGAGILEVGCDAGGTLWAFQQIEGQQVWGLTLNGGPFSTKRELQRGQAGVIVGNSHDPATLEALLRVHPERFDAVFVDGDHSFIGAYMDFMVYGARVRPGGILAMHDVAVHPPETGCEVHRAWALLSHTSPPGVELDQFIAEPGNWGGIGLARLP